MKNSSLQRSPKRSNHGTVSTVLKEAPGVTSADRRDRPSHRLYRSLAGPSLGFAQDTLDLGEGFFDGIEVRRVGRQVQELGSPLLDQLAYPLSLVGRAGRPPRRPARLANSGRASSRRKPRTPRGRWRPPPPGTVPCPRPSCSKAPWCSAPGCEAPNNRPFAQGATRRAAPTAVRCWRPSRLRRPSASDRSAQRA